MQRRATRTVWVGDVPLGGEHPIVIQSMTNTDTCDIRRTLQQIERLAEAGCQLVRVAVPDIESARALQEICKQSPVPVIADIHFDHNLALAGLAAGVAKLRINPGTMAGSRAVARVVTEAARLGVPIRVGVNSGSIHGKYRHLPRAEALVKSALYYCQVIEDLGCRDIVVSLKSSSVRETFEATGQFARRSDYPLHLGVTEAGTELSGIIKSSIGIGGLLLQGIGDTLRVSVTGPPEKEIPIALGILQALGLREGPEVISCPTCARSGHDVLAAAREVERYLAGIKLPLRVAVMGCAVNGPGEARHAHVGIAFGPKQGVLFRRGQVVATLPNARLLPALLALVAEEGAELLGEKEGEQ